MRRSAFVAQDEMSCPKTCRQRTGQEFEPRPSGLKLSVLPTDAGPQPVTAYEIFYAFTSLLFVTYQVIKQNIIEIRSLFKDKVHI
jgi:hypothetical protein